MHSVPFSRFHGSTWRDYTKKIFAICSMIFMLGFGALYVYSGRFIAQNVYFEGQLVEGMTREEVFPIVSDRVKALAAQEIEITDLQGVQYRFSPADLGLEFDAEKTVDALFKAGRSLWLKAQALSDPLSKRFIEPVLKANRIYVQTVIAKEFLKGEYPTLDARLMWSIDKGWAIQEARPGRRLVEGEVERIADSILDGIYNLDDKKVYRARYERVTPKVFGSDLGEMLARAVDLSQEPLKVHFGKVTESLDVPLEADQWLDFDYVKKTVGPKEDQVTQYATDFAVRYDIEPSTVIVKRIDEFPSEYTQGTYKKAVIEGEFVSGRTIDQNKLVADLSQVLMQVGDRKVDVTFKQVPVTVKSEVPGMEFPQLVSLGQSSYQYGNESNRVHNIKRALELEDLTVVDAGEVFSYNKVLGWVTYEKGFVNGQVIFGDGLANVAGGGVCQTSTTMFRAIVNAGLPVTERINHSWDVHYYQDWHGVDATVYPPGKIDLGFLNDMPGPILVHSYTDDTNEMAYFELYGTSDGRTVRTETVQNYKVGAGRKIVTNWEVTYPDGVVDQRQIVSRYKR
ncbi:MAG: VanW family protein [Candidatus Peregrinibacteria bacterium]